MNSVEYFIEPADLVATVLKYTSNPNLDWARNKPWTTAVKTALGSLQSEIQDIIYTRPEEHLSEFLLDVVAWERNNGEGLVLAAECEWGQTPSEIKQDFEKLLVVKCSTKLMVFASPDRDATQQSLWEAIEDSMRNFKHHSNGERYVFIDLAKGTRRRAWWFQIEVDGRMPSLPPFQKLFGE